MIGIRLLLRLQSFPLANSVGQKYAVVFVAICGKELPR